MSNYDIIKMTWSILLQCSNKKMFCFLTLLPPNAFRFCSGIGLCADEVCTPDFWGIDTWGQGQRLEGSLDNERGDREPQI